MQCQKVYLDKSDFCHLNTLHMQHTSAHCSCGSVDGASSSFTNERHVYWWLNLVLILSCSCQRSQEQTVGCEYKHQQEARQSDEKHHGVGWIKRLSHLYTPAECVGTRHTWVAGHDTGRFCMTVLLELLISCCSYRASENCQFRAW